MQQILRMLNSNEQFHFDDSFSLHILHIRNPGHGSGHKRIKKATMAIKKLLDDLCCTRAIVTMKAYCDLGSQHDDY